MSAELYTFVGNRELPFANPMGEAAMRRALELAMAGKGRGCAVADFGAGFCELPILLAAEHGAKVQAIELAPSIASAARERVRRRLSGESGGSVEVLQGDAGGFKAAIEPERFDLTVCIGSSQALGGLDTAIRTLTRVTKRGGRVLVGEMFWKGEPSEVFCAESGIGPKDLGKFGTVFQAGIMQGLTPLWGVSASEREFDEYEWAHARAIERYLSERPDDVMAHQVAARRRKWSALYVREGRSAVGFGLYLMERDLRD